MLYTEKAIHGNKNEKKNDECWSVNGHLVRTVVFVIFISHI